MEDTTLNNQSAENYLKGNTVGIRGLKLIPVAARPKVWVCGLPLSRIVGSNPPPECCVLSGRGFCVGLITRPEDSYRVCCV